MEISKCSCCIGLFVIMIILFSYMTRDETVLLCDGFRNAEQKKDIAERLVAAGRPNRDAFRAGELDGVEYYDAKQLWQNNKYSSEHIQGIL
jgi:hypothetical protein